jgi:hypothetical protein
MRKGKLVVVINGDLYDGVFTSGGGHHGTSQIVTSNPEPIEYIADRVFGVITKMKPAKIYVVRGTEAHSGPNGTIEEARARLLRAVKDEHDKSSTWHLRLQAHDVTFDIQHHTNVSGLPWTRAGAVTRLAARVWMEHQLRGLPAPHIAIRSHVHRFADSFGAYPTRAIITPAWQLKTAFGHRVAPDNIADVGGIIVTVYGSDYDVAPVLYTPALPTWQVVT